MVNDSNKKITPGANSLPQVIVIPPSLPEHLSAYQPADMVYVPVPHNYLESDNKEPRRVLLKFASPPGFAFGLDVYDDIVLGRGYGQEDEEPADVDFSYHKASEQGVSRRHVMLRPTSNKLVLIDMDSTNGSFVNTIPIGRGMAQVLRNGDRIAMAGLDFRIEFVDIQQKFIIYDLEAIGDLLGLGAPGDSSITGAHARVTENDLQKDRNPTLPPGAVPFVKSLRTAPVTPIRGDLARQPRIRWVGHDEDDDKLDEKDKKPEK